MWRNRALNNERNGRINDRHELSAWLTMGLTAPGQEKENSRTHASRNANFQWCYETGSTLTRSSQGRHTKKSPIRSFTLMIHAATIRQTEHARYRSMGRFILSVRESRSVTCYWWFWCGYSSSVSFIISVNSKTEEDYRWNRQETTIITPVSEWSSFPTLSEVLETKNSCEEEQKIRHCSSSWCISSVVSSGKPPCHCPECGFSECVSPSLDLRWSSAQTTP